MDGRLSPAHRRATLGAKGYPKVAKAESGFIPALCWVIYLFSPGPRLCRFR